MKPNRIFKSNIRNQNGCGYEGRCSYWDIDDAKYDTTSPQTKRGFTVGPRNRNGVSCTPSLWDWYWVKYERFSDFRWREHTVLNMMISIANFLQVALVSTFLQIAEAQEGVPLSQVRIEVSEDTLVQTLPTVKSQMAEIRITHCDLDGLNCSKPGPTADVKNRGEPAHAKNVGVVQ